MECLRAVVTQLHQIAVIIYQDRQFTATQHKSLSSVLDCLDTLQREYAASGTHTEVRHILHIISLMAASLKDDRIAATLCILVFSKLVLAALQSSASTKLITRGYNRPLQRTLQILRGGNATLAVQFDWANKRDVLAVIASHLSTYNISSIQPTATIDIVSQQIMQAAQSVVNTRSTVAGLDNGELCINYHTVAGPEVCRTRAMQNTLLMDIPVARDTELAIANVCKVRGFIVALFDCSLELSEGNMKQSIQLETTALEWETRGPSAEIELLEEFALQLHRSHVTFVGCQKRVHPYLLRRLRALNMVCVARISIRFMAALQKLSGARQLGSITPLSVLQKSCLDPTSLGCLYAVDYQYIYGKPFVVAQGYPSRNMQAGSQDVESAYAAAAAFQDHLLDAFEHLPVDFVRSYVKAVVARQSSCTTMLVTAPTEALCAQWRDAIESTTAYLRKLRREEARVLPGGGMWLAALARELETAISSGDGAGATRDINSQPVKSLSRQQRQIQAAESEFQRIIKECAVIAGGVNEGAYGDAGESCISDIRGFIAPMHSGNAVTAFTAFRNPRGDVVRVKRIGSSMPGSAPKRCQYSLHSEGAEKPNGVPHLCVKLDNFDANMRALAIATDMASTLLEVDGFVSAAASITDHV